MSSVLTLTVSQLSTNTFTQKLNSKVTTIRRSSCVLMLSLWSQVVLIDDLIVDASQEAETIQSGASVGLTPRREKKGKQKQSQQNKGSLPPMLLRLHVSFGGKQAFYKAIYWGVGFYLRMDG